jgi:MFS family permease
VRFSARLSALTDKASLPPGLNNAYLFALFNALSFQVVLSSPMVLYAKSLHASATVLGIITGMMPLLVIFQIPAASYIGRVGYKRFVFAGWGTRVTFIFGMALVPLTGIFLNEGSRLGLILALLFGFNLSRGISSCAWLPWISALVPAEVRGTYLARDAACVNLACFLSLFLAAFGLGSSPRAWQFAMLFAFSAIMGAISLTFLKRIPDRPSTEEAGGSKGPVPWAAMLRFRPFQKLLYMVVAWSLAYGGITAFSVVFLKSGVGMPEGRILLLSSVSYLGGLWSLWFLGSRVDGLGSKPVLTFSFALWVMVLLGWMALAGGAVKPGAAIILALQLLMGLFAALIAMSNTRLAMAVVPALGRNHFFALYSVITNVALGLAPIGWGIVIDAIGGHEIMALGLSWNRFSIFFAAVALVMLAALFFARKLEEPKAASLEVLLREILIQSPQRVLVRLWPRE